MRMVPVASDRRRRHFGMRLVVAVPQVGLENDEAMDVSRLRLLPVVCPHSDQVKSI